MNYFKDNKPGWFSIFLPSLVTIVVLYLLVKGYVDYNAVAWAVCALCSAACALTVWYSYWRRNEELSKLHRENVPGYPLYTFYHGTEAAYKTLFYKRKDQYGKDMPEFIIGSSFEYKGKIYTCMIPGRHHHCFRLIGFLGHKDPYISSMLRDQGFMTNYGRHVDRREAFLIAVAAKQLIDKSGNVGDCRLHSEDVWETSRPYMDPDWVVPGGKGRPDFNTNAVTEIYRQHMKDPEAFETDVRAGTFTLNQI